MHCVLIDLELDLLYYFYKVILICFIPAQVVLFSAARTTTAVPPLPSYYRMQETTAQRGQSYNLNTASFTAPLDGTYVFHLSTGVSSGAYLGVSIVLGSTRPFVYRMSTYHNGFDMMSRDFIYSLTKGRNVYLEPYSGYPTSDGLRQTSWSAFLLDNLMYPKIAFCVSATLPAPTGKIDFDVINVNAGNAWNTATDLFTAPRTGVYVFSLNCGVGNGQSNQVSVYINNVQRNGLYLGSTTHNGYDMISRMVVVSLTAGDTVFAGLDLGNLWNDGNVHSTSFAGFLYEPLDGRKVIWSVHQTKSTNGYYGNFLFDYVSLNIGNGWNSTANKFVVPYAGIYQLHLTATSNNYAQVDYQLWWNDVAYASIYVTTTSHNGAETRSRAILVEASIGYTFYIVAVSYSSLFSNALKLISFAEFLLSP